MNASASKRSTKSDSCYYYLQKEKNQDLEHPFTKLDKGSVNSYGQTDRLLFINQVWWSNHCLQWFNL